MKVQAPIEVLIVDDHPVVLEGLAAVISSDLDMRVVGQARTGREAIEHFRLHRPTVTLVDLRLPDMSGMDVISTLRREYGETGFVVLTVLGGDEDIFRAMQEGARGYLHKDATKEEILQAIRMVAHGDRYIQVGMASRLADRLASGNPSLREIEVLQLMATGKSNKEIAFELSVGEGTVKTHVGNMVRKLGVSSRTQAILTAARRGMVRLVDKKER
ncbi:MAG: response regulator transcription factor [Acidobacteria bacterium]|nr:response regulator transcription factor [Acidobacteriota bacterium]